MTIRSSTDAERAQARGKVIKIDGEDWEIENLGVHNEGKVFAALISTTRGTQCKNGWHPCGIGVWIDEALLA